MLPVGTCGLTRSFRNMGRQVISELCTAGVQGRVWYGARVCSVTGKVVGKSCAGRHGQLGVWKDGNVGKRRAHPYWRVVAKLYT